MCRTTWTRVAGAILTLLLGGCQTSRPLYFWGSYDALVYQSYSSPTKSAPEYQIQRLEADLQKAAAGNQPVAPGMHAYLGYLYYQVGQHERALKEFDREKALFPESGPFLDRLLARVTEAKTP